MPLHAKTYVGEAEAKLSMTNPLNGGLIHRERLAILWIDPALDRRAETDSVGTGNAAAGGGEVSYFGLAGNRVSL